MEIEKKTLERLIEYFSGNPEVKIVRGYPEYSHQVYEALSLLDTDIDYQNNYDKISDTPIENYTLENIATMFTFISRGERFCDGHIASFVENGTILKLLKQLKKIAGN